MSESRFLVVLGVQSIKKYVFGTDRLKEIRGASALLDNFNRDGIVQFLENSKDLSSVKPVFVGGGAGQFIITSTEEALQNCLKELEGILRKETGGGARLNWGKARYTGANYQQALKIAELGATKNNEETPFHPFTPIHTGFIRECDSCSQMATPHPSKYGDVERILCDVCFSKVAYNYDKAKRDLWQDCAQFLKKKEVYPKRPQSFEEIGDQCQAKKGYTALVYADGNSMGKLIKKIDNDNLFTLFSEIVDTSIREACHEALYETVFGERGITPEIMPAEILMLGGDDLLVYLTAETAFPFAIKVAEKFSEKSIEKIEKSSEQTFFMEKLAGKGLTISLGIAYGRSRTPFSILLNQAEELLKSAKKAGSKDPRSKGNYSPTYIDYHLSSNFNQARVENTRKTHLKYSGKKTVRLYQKPYFLEDAKALLDSARNIVEIDIPRTRLRRLGYAPSLGKMNGTLECLKIYTRTRKEQREALWNALSRFNCIENMPWNEGESEDTTMLIDLMEIVDFCGKGNLSEREDNEP